MPPELSHGTGAKRRISSMTGRPTRDGIAPDGGSAPGRDP
jgi:hypothetical protein